MRFHAVVKIDNIFGAADVASKSVRFHGRTPQASKKAYLSTGRWLLNVYAKAVSAWSPMVFFCCKHNSRCPLIAAAIISKFFMMSIPHKDVFTRGRKFADVARARIGIDTAINAAPFSVEKDFLACRDTRTITRCRVRKTFFLPPQWRVFDWRGLCPECVFCAVRPRVATLQINCFHDVFHCL